ncbi:MAG TPA: c-type cytochrome [Burkholderiales bacterium]|nr:c-type cytochrome [Burkholderiales bacterium]
MSTPGSLALFGLAGLCVLAAGCEAPPNPPGVSGDAERGRTLLSQYGCGTCHSIPGVRSANANVGPPLKGVANRVYLAGVLTNTPTNMVRWIRAPQDVDPRTAMPNMNVTEAHAQDIAAYLYRLK